MAKKGEKKHLKRLNAPKSWKMPRKRKKWTVSTSPGPHSGERALPISVLLRENLGLVRTKKEAEKVLAQGDVMVDGKVRKNSKYPVGFMDVIKLSETGDCWRILFDKKGYLYLHEIGEDESGYKLEKVIGKIPFKGGKLQLSLKDGKTITGEFDNVSVGDTLKISLPELEVQDHIPRGVGSLALVTGGSNVGRGGKIKEIVNVEGPSSDRFVIESDGEEFQSPEKYVFVIGENSPEISLPEVD
ncbi:hypothetical protein AKJ41_02910 [candidate division MSBL1 archaeon SCGC-AAA259O05]|uniref:Small ribosomal subunit protein eS4 n=1 Tax=candidate division MSBL1 archaeon SCGC-AAA259O05 TaxID=1698271 RepID=A0A133V3M9_9EURY|nr:hypothetical protein AKJ41_02910 [candidate division MSBL1 archaeon SCGC-AAA259O05]